MTLKATKQLASAPVPPAAAGQIDTISQDGWVQGWAWYPAAPDEALDVEFLVDGTPVGAVTASEFRHDLLANGIGQGNHGFRFALPDAALTDAGMVTVTVRDQMTSQPIGDPTIFRRKVAVVAQAQIDELTARLQFLEARQENLSRQQANGASAAAELFATVGQFFFQIADAAASGRPSGTAKTLQGAIDDVQAALPRLELEYASNPSVTVQVASHGTLSEIYQTVRAVRETTSGVRVEILLLDDGTNPQVALLPTVITNLRYVRAAAPSAAAALWDQAARLARGKILVCLDSGLVPEGCWLRDLIARFGSNPALAMMGAKLVASDGLVKNIGLKLENGIAAAIGAGQNSASSTLSHPRHIDSAAPAAFALRLEVWASAGGFGEASPQAEMSLIDFCKRVRSNGGAIIFEPHFVVTARGEATTLAG